VHIHARQRQRALPCALCANLSRHMQVVISARKPATTRRSARLLCMKSCLTRSHEGSRLSRCARARLVANTRRAPPLTRNSARKHLISTARHACHTPKLKSKRMPAELDCNAATRRRRERPCDWWRTALRTLHLILYTSGHACTRIIAVVDHAPRWAHHPAPLRMHASTASASLGRAAVVAAQPPPHTTRLPARRMHSNTPSSHAPTIVVLT